MRALVTDWIIEIGIAESAAGYISNTLFIFLIVFLVYISDMITKRIFLKGLGTLVKKTRTSWDDVFYEKQVLNGLRISFRPSLSI